MKIAICGYSEKIKNYLHAFELAGCPLTVIDDKFNCNDFDGFILPGGGDVNPKLYNQENLGSDSIDDKLDSIQYRTLEKFVNANKPILGICRGFQFINIYFGGTLIQDLNVKGIHRCLPGEDHDMYHEIHTVGNNFLKDLYGNQFLVNSYHHQAIDKLGDGLIADAYSDNNVIEAIHHRDFPIIGVQFHPERLSYDLRKNNNTIDGSLLLKYFIEMCK